VSTQRNMVKSEVTSGGFLRKKTKKKKGAKKKQAELGTTPAEKKVRLSEGIHKPDADSNFTANGKNLGKRRRAAAKRQREKEAKAEARLQAPTDNSAKTSADPPSAGKKGKKKAKEDKVNDSEGGEKVEKTPGEATPQRTPGLGVNKSLKKPAKGGVLDALKSRLSGGRFRYLNESLYTTTGAAAFEQFSEAPELFDQYHAGFRAQTAKWPVSPLQVCVKWLAQHPPSWTVADFGCGDAELAKLVKQKVMSLDLVARTPDVIACNISDTPLESGAMDAVVFCLALMGTDYSSFLLEAHRVLRAGGGLWIAEVRSRLEKENVKDGDVTKDFLAALKKVGFELIKQDNSNKMFVVFELKKSSSKKAAAVPAKSVTWPELKACTYKKR